ncbi:MULTISPECIES: hypothetical protein [Pseudomonas]|uniref:Fap n=1 Tax=Pseudomonas asplenii TaxID=53407 RepID=A0A0N0E501_9PSED|nr:hypothetical protein PF66_01506 [Pseudomonas fuscovaginae]KPA95418.1 hypothetical protein PF70_04604 [Pseudomonas fuscovaginae]
MGMTRTALTRTLLIGCAIGSLFSLTAEAGGNNGVIVLERTVQPQMYGRPPLQPDPNPTTVNANPSARVISLTNGMELSDGDIAGISTGATVNRVITVHTEHMPGLSNPNGLPGLSSGHGGGSGASIANTVNRGLSAGMGALNAIGKGQ